MSINVIRVIGVLVALVGSFYLGTMYGSWNAKVVFEMPPPFVGKVEGGEVTTNTVMSLRLDLTNVDAEYDFSTTGPRGCYQQRLTVNKQDILLWPCGQTKVYFPSNWQRADVFRCAEEVLAFTLVPRPKLIDFIEAACKVKP